MRWTTNILVAVLCVVAVFLAGMVVHLSAKLSVKEETIRLLRESVGLREQLVAMQKKYRDKTVELCRLQNRYGEAYRATLAKLIVDLGLDERPNSATAILLKELGYGVGGGP